MLSQQTNGEGRVSYERKSHPRHMFIARWFSNISDRRKNCGVIFFYRVERTASPPPIVRGGGAASAALEREVKRPRSTYNIALMVQPRPRCGSSHRAPMFVCNRCAFTSPIAWHRSASVQFGVNPISNHILIVPGTGAFAGVRRLLGSEEDHLVRLCWGCRQCLLTPLL